MYTIKLNIGSWGTPVLGGGYVLANPILDGVTLSKKRDDEQRQIVRTKVNGGIQFYNNASNREFDVLKSLNDAGKTFIDAKLYFNGSERLTGIINLNTGIWDENKKTQLLEFQSSDEYTNVLRGGDEKYDITDDNDLTANIVIRSSVHTEISSCYEGKIFEFKDNVNPNGSINTTGIRNAEWVYFDFINPDNLCGEAGQIYTYRTTYFTFATPGYFESEQFPGWWIKEGSSQQLTIPIEFRWAKLYTIIKNMLAEIDSSINIHESTYCTYFTEDNPELNFLMLADKSDVKRYDASNKAPFEYMTFNELMETLKNMFNVEWTIRSGFFKLRRPEVLSLPSFITLPKHDFTTINRGQSICDNQKVYQYNQNNKFYKETWEMEPSNDSRYSNKSITYDSLSENKMDYSLLNYNNNISYLVNDPDEANDSGFAMVATEGTSSTNRDIINETVGGIELVNYKLSVLNLIQENHLTDRPYNKGTVNGTERTLTKRPDRMVSFSNVPIFDVDDLDFNYLVKCDVDDVVPESIEIDISLKNFSKFEGAF